MWSQNDYEGQCQNEGEIWVLRWREWVKMRFWKLTARNICQRAMSMHHFHFQSQPFRFQLSALVLVRIFFTFVLLAIATAHRRAARTGHAFRVSSKESQTNNAAGPFQQVTTVHLCSPILCFLAIKHLYSAHKPWSTRMGRVAVSGTA